MLPGKARILVCPFCGKENEVMSLISWNTFGAECWSDGRVIGPGIREISYVQKCRHCRKYYTLARQDEKYAEHAKLNKIICMIMQIENQMEECKHEKVIGGSLNGGSYCRNACGMRRQ